MCTQVLLSGDTLSANGDADEAARARVRFAWVKFEELSTIPKSRGASYHMKENVFWACIQSVLTNGPQVWNHSLIDLHDLLMSYREF